jgi:hypothetical protein
MNKRYIAILLGGLVVLAISATVAVTLLSQNHATPTPISPGGPLPSPGATVTYEGELTCLPHKGNGPHTMECAIGLQLSDGRHLGLQNTTDRDPSYIHLPTGTRLIITGTFNTDAAASKYNIIGSLNVTSARPLK